jgi:HPr kinase/phosphorylase
VTIGSVPRPGGAGPSSTMPPAGPAPSATPAPSRPLPATSATKLLDDPELGLSIVMCAGDAGRDRPIDHPRIQKSGLALAGHFHGIMPSRIQILGLTEQSYLDTLDRDERRAALLGQARNRGGFFGLGLSCVVLTGGGSCTSREDLALAADETETPLLVATERSSAVITSLHALLDERLAPRKRLHGVLVDVFGVGLLLMGPSGVGKSECALDLVMRGHRLVADDVVECDYRPPGMIFGAPATLLRHHLEVRGLGILNVKDLYGVTAIRERKRVDVVVRLVEDGAPGAVRVEVDRLGLDERFFDILGVAVPELVVPVRPGRDMASILEVAARNELLKNAGHHAGRELLGQVDAQVGGLDKTASSRPGGASSDGVRPRRPSPSKRRLDESSAPPPVAAALTPARGIPSAGPAPTLRAPESQMLLPRTVRANPPREERAVRGGAQVPDRGRDEVPPEAGKR